MTVRPLGVGAVVTRSRGPNPGAEESSQPLWGAGASTSSPPARSTRRTRMSPAGVGSTVASPIRPSTRARTWTLGRELDEVHHASPSAAACARSQATDAIPGRGGHAGGRADVDATIGSEVHDCSARDRSSSGVARRRGSCPVRPGGAPYRWWCRRRRAARRQPTKDAGTNARWRRRARCRSPARSPAVDGELLDLAADVAGRRFRVVPTTRRPSS